MLRLVVAAVIIAVASGQRSHAERCEYYQHLDCNTFGMSDVCASNNKTYMNHCAMSKAWCQDHNVHQQHEGACGSGAPLNPINGHEVSFVYYCYAVRYNSCGDDHEALCGTDNTTYPNVCSFEKAKCDDMALDVKNVGSCK